MYICKQSLNIYIYILNFSVSTSRHVISKEIHSETMPCVYPRFVWNQDHNPTCRDPNLQLRLLDPCRKKCLFLGWCNFIFSEEFWKGGIKISRRLCFTMVSPLFPITLLSPHPLNGPMIVRSPCQRGPFGIAQFVEGITHGITTWVKQKPCWS